MRILTHAGNRPADSLLHLHHRAVAGDSTAVDELAATLLPILLRRLRSAFPAVSKDLVADAATDAIMDYAQRPSRFDHSRGVSLQQFLYRAGWRNLADAVDSERRRRLREYRYVCAFQSQPVAQDFPDRSTLDDIEGRVLAAARNLAELRACKSVIAGDRATDILARALGLCHLSLREQQREVKRFKDRILKRIRRQHQVTPHFR